MIATTHASDTLRVLQDTVRVHLTHQQTAGGVFVMEVAVPPGGGPPPIHTRPPHELFFTLEGELTYFRDDGGDALTVITGGPGTTAFMPGGVGHTYRNFSDAPGRYLAVVSPGPAMQDFLMEAGVGAGETSRTPDEVVALSEPYGFRWSDVVPGPRGWSRAMAIELRLLRSFVAVAEERHVGKAATRLYISQPALSQQIRALEAQVGVPLLVRHPRGVELTDAGGALLAEARGVLSRSDRLESTVEDLRRVRAAVLRIGVPPGVPRDLVPPLMAALRDAQPGARVEIAELTTPEQLAALRDESLDLGFVREPVEDRELAWTTLLVEPLGVSLPHDHPLAVRPALTLEEIAGELFVCFPRAWAPSLHDVLVGELRARGLDARFQESAHAATTAGMVAAGHGLTLSARPWLDGAAGIAWRPLADVEIAIRTAAAWRAHDRAPLLRTLVGLLPAYDPVQGGMRPPA